MCLHLDTIDDVGGTCTYIAEVNTSSASEKV